MSIQINQQLLSSLINVQELYEQAPCGYVSFLPAGTVIKINKTLLGWLGFTEEEILFQKKFTDLISKSGRMHFEMFFQPMINIKGSVKEISYELMKKDGTFLPALISATAVSGNEGIVAINLAVSDNTDRKKYERELLLAKRFADAEKKRFEYLANLIPEIVWTADNSGVIDYVNGRFFQYFNIAGNNFDAKVILSRIDNADHPRILRLWIKSIQKGNDLHAEVRLRNAQNEYEWHLLKAIPYRNEEQVITKWFGSCININEQINAIERKDEFIKIASHELKTPLTSLKIYLEILQMSDIREDYKSLADKAAARVNNLQFLISSLLDVSHINSGELILSLAKFSLAEIISDTIDQVRYLYTSHEIELHIDTTEKFMVYADKERITQVIINLVNNAVKYSPGQNKVIVKVHKTEQAKMVLVEVIDFGPGILKDKQQLIFEKYYRVIENNKSITPGLGLGLYIIQNIMLRHQSRIFVTSNKNKGSVFYFSLPYDQTS